jgi:hypothetical protein
MRCPAPSYANSRASLRSENLQTHALSNEELPAAGRCCSLLHLYQYSTLSAPRHFPLPKLHLPATINESRATVWCSKACVCILRRSSSFSSQYFTIPSPTYLIHVPTMAPLSIPSHPIPHPPCSAPTNFQFPHSMSPAPRHRVCAHNIYETATWE